MPSPFLSASRTGALAALLALAACSREHASPSPSPTASPTPSPTASPSPSPTASPTPSAAPAGPTGRILGTVKLVGAPPEMPLLQRGSDPVCGKTPARAETVVTDGGGLVNAVVRLPPGSVPGWVPSTPVVIDQVDCLYRPRVQVGVVGQPLQVGNSDATAHNVNARRVAWGKREDQDILWNRAQPKGAAPIGEPLPTGVDVLKLKCDMHGWMQGFVVVSDNPYGAVSGAGGRFAIEGVPVGDHEVQAWHELYGVKTARVSVAAGAEATVEIVYDAAADRPATVGGTPAAPAATALPPAK